MQKVGIITNINLRKLFGTKSRKDLVSAGASNMGVGWKCVTWNKAKLSVDTPTMQVNESIIVLQSRFVQFLDKRGWKSTN